MTTHFGFNIFAFSIGYVMLGFTHDAIASEKEGDDLPAANVEFAGWAYTKGTNELVYIEKHKGYQEKANTFLWLETIYKEPNGKTIAKKIARFDKNKYVPDSEFEDIRLGRKEISKLDPEKKLLHIEMRNGVEKKTTSATIPVDELTVSGQGFNNYLVDFLDSEKKEPKRIKFIIIPKMTYYYFEVQHKGSTEALKSFLIQIDNFFLKKIVPSLEVVFKENKIYTFQGLSNIESPDGKSQEVLIKYSLYNPPG